MSQGEREPEVASFYLHEFWTPLKLDALSSQAVANRILDMAVNANKQVSVRLLQRAVVKLLGWAVEVDGWMGPRTLLGANSCNEYDLLEAYRTLRVGFYQQVVVAHAEDVRYLAEWTKRAEA